MIRRAGLTAVSLLTLSATPVAAEGRESQSDAGRRDATRAARGMGVRRAFAAGGTPRMAGRVEHLASGRSEHFGSLPELLVFLSRVLKNLREDVEQGKAPSGEAR